MDNVFARFENRKAREFFLQLSNSLEGENKESFSKKVCALFNEKIVSEEGQYAEFTITEKDVAELYDSVTSSKVTA